MKKSIYFVSLLLFFDLLTGCSRISNMIVVDREKIGAEYIGLSRAVQNVKGDWGIIENHTSELNGNVWTTEFDYMNGTNVKEFTIESDDELLITSNVANGEVWVKITQGDLSKSEIQKVQAINGEDITVDLSQWQGGEINIWLVVEEGDDGIIQIERIEK